MSQMVLFASYCCDTEQSSLGTEGSPCLTVTAREVIREGTGERNRSSDRGRVLLPDLLPLACSVSFLYNPGPPAQGWHCPLWAWPSQIHYEARKGPPRFATGQSHGDISSSRASSSQRALVSNHPSVPVIASGVPGFTFSNWMQIDSLTQASPT